jgi:hypothetical protein
MQNDSRTLELTQEQLARLREALSENLRGHREDYHAASGLVYQSYLEGCMDTEQWVLEQLALCTRKHEPRGFE